MFFDSLSDFLGGLAEFAAGLDPWQQALFLVVVGAISFVESYGGALIGTILGVNPVLAVAAPVIGNVICTFVLIAIAAKTRQAVQRKRSGSEPAELTKRQQKVQRALDRYGVPGVCLFGPLLVASQITAPTLIALGARPAKVYLFQGVSIVLWGVAFMLLGSGILAGVQSV